MAQRGKPKKGAVAVAVTGASAAGMSSSRKPAPRGSSGTPSVAEAKSKPAEAKPAAAKAGKHAAATKPPAKPAAKVKPVGSAAPGRDRLAEVEAECARLRAELAEASQEIERLRQRQELVVNRIDWVIDSLHNLIEGDG